jgi:hypothetical protein
VSMQRHHPLPPLPRPVTRVAAAAAPPVNPQQQQEQLQHAPFISAVAWQRAAAGAALGLPAILAAGTSAGHVSLLTLQCAH